MEWSGVRSASVTAQLYYVIGIILLAVLSVRAVSLLPVEALGWCGQFTGRLVVTLYGLLDIPAEVKGDIFTVAGFAMRMVAE